MRYGLKHAVLVFVFLLYATLGAAIMALIEIPAQEAVKAHWERDLAVSTYPSPLDAGHKAGLPLSRPTGVTL